MTGSITLFSTLAVRKALDDVVLAAFTADTGIAVHTVFDPTVQLVRRIDAGEAFDVMIGVTGSFDPLAERGIVDLATRTPIARSGIGLAVPPGAPLPDIADKDAFVRTLLGARSVAYSVTGASGIYFARLIQDLGIADRLNERATIIEKGFIAEAVVDGRADVAIQQLSELLFVPEARIVGPFPAEVQHYTEFSATLAAGAASEEARAFVDYLTGPGAAAAYRRTNLETA
ncbi:molybdate ABC transporter substrate-binding protein [Glycomyces harbinensis]|uniref:Molybdate transport system substrate-binding protein n=1 Tax=Glycomyces harbinensis TaxID=58114 RepID=A0A1G6W0P3_9ACTN|nr:substrate-binding domain-containing protein [Glycomyces harbinensis]SDD59520.1 molybdate transport system substrate-binding protein [Glycomyces harbinensis]